MDRARAGHNLNGMSDHDMDQEAKYWRDKWKEVVRQNIDLRQEILNLRDAAHAQEADRETVKRLKGNKKTK